MPGLLVANPMRSAKLRESQLLALSDHAPAARKGHGFLKDPSGWPFQLYDMAKTWMDGVQPRVRSEPILQGDADYGFCCEKIS